MIALLDQSSYFKDHIRHWLSYFYHIVVDLCCPFLSLDTIKMVNLSSISLTIIVLILTPWRHSFHIIHSVPFFIRLLSLSIPYPFLPSFLPSLDPIASSFLCLLLFFFSKSWISPWVTALSSSLPLYFPHDFTLSLLSILFILSLSHSSLLPTRQNTRWHTKFWSYFIFISLFPTIWIEKGERKCEVSLIG